MAAKSTGMDIKLNYVTVTLCLLTAARQYYIHIWAAGGLRKKCVANKLKIIMGLVLQLLSTTAAALRLSIKANAMSSGSRILRLNQRPVAASQSSLVHSMLMC